MKERLIKILGVEPNEAAPVGMLLGISFLMGLFIATVTVAAQSLFLNAYSEKDDLPVVLVLGGGLGFIATGLFNILQGRIPFRFLATGFLVLIIAATAFLEFGDAFVVDKKLLYYVGFALILPFTFISQLVFWGAFNRIFSLRQAKRVVGSVDIGMDIAQIIAFFTIPVLLNFGVKTEYLFTIGLFSIIGYLVLFNVLSSRYLTTAAIQAAVGVLNEKENKRISLSKFFSTRYIVLLSLFVVVSFTALRFIDYSFYNITTTRFDSQELPVFLSLFEATVIIFSFLFGLFAADKIQEDYGLRVSLIINPLLLIIFTSGALALGFFFGYDPTKSSADSIVFFFIMVAMSKLVINSLRDALDSPIFKFYYVPIEKSIKLDAQTKIEGTVTATATILAGGLIVLINQFKIFDLLSITLFTLPLLFIWYFITNRMYNGYRHTLQDS
ncbi:MAG: hypothetical protein K2X37_01915, partial [Chitinophagaceae bacterium]|nr:hypothetical protein [Chitinophagaceae bacterium]